MERSTQVASFTLVQPNTAPARLALHDHVITIGRANDCTIPIRDRFLSRHHAEIRFETGNWILRDSGSANGTTLNGSRVENPVTLQPGDRIAFGDCELVFERPSPSEELSLEDSRPETRISMHFDRAVADETMGRRSDKLSTLNALALELLEDRSMDELFDFILDRLMRLLRPSRAAIALLGDGQPFSSMRVRRVDASDTSQLSISRTLLAEVVEERKVISFIAGDSADARLAQAASIMSQSIRSALCAPLMVSGNVVGVLYVDFTLSQPNIVEDDVRFFAQIARFAAMKLETTRLREESIAKKLMDEELKTAYLIQSKLLPAAPPDIAGYRFAGINRPCKTVSGDYFDYVVRPDGRIYFVIADVSGKGITAALIMSAVATGFAIFTRSDPSPAALVAELNATLVPKLSPSRFVTLLAGVLDPQTGVVRYANAGHAPPWHRSGDGARELKETDLVIGLFAHARYREHEIVLSPGDVLVAFTDGVTEAEDAAEEQLGTENVGRAITATSGDAAAMIEHLVTAVSKHVAATPLGDDLTIVALSRDA